MASFYDALVPGISYWLAIDEQLDSHRFRVIRYTYISDTFYTCEYGNVSRRRENHIILVDIKPKGRRCITVTYQEADQPSEQEMLSLLVFWAAKPLFLAVPVSEITQEQTQQEPLF